ncbi:MAG: EAL domain-containing protein [Hyphomicrobium sp.]|nr:EAL domain-containing protein [Hyphomicrobium sp.]
MRLGRCLITLITVLASVTAAATGANALDAIAISPDQDRIEITTLGQLYEGRGDSLQVETAASADGTTGRMSVRAATPGTNPSWLVFALTNTSEVAIERWLTADRYHIIGSGIVWPDLDAQRIEAVTPSIGFVPERMPSDRADVFRITLEPGQTITYIAELSSERLARIHLWKPLGYELKVRERQLFNGIMIGLTSLLAIFLTSIFAANHKVIFPVAALFAWCVLGYLCVDFGFFYKLFQLKPENTAVHRAATEAAMAASLVIFLYFYLRIQLWHGLARMLFGVWIVAQLALVAIAVVDPRLASTFARLSFAAIVGGGGVVTLFLALRGQDRAFMLIPTWTLFAVWVFGAAVTLTGQLSGDMVVSGLVAGLVLIGVLIGFTVTQFAFRSLDPMYGATPSELQLRSAAVEAAGAAVWEWSARRDEIRVSPILEAALGLNLGELNTKVEDFCRHMHQADRERFRLSLVSAQERGTGSLQTEFRMRHADNSYRWFSLEAAPVPSSDGRTVKCVGLLRDVTDQKRAHERLVSDAVNCRLTGIPNREILLDRLQIAIRRAETEGSVRPTILFIDLDKFKSVNNNFGVVVGDSLLLTVARRLQRHLEPADTIARVGGDQFAILLLKEQTAVELAAFAERVRRSLRSPIKIAGQDIVLTGSLGIAIWDGHRSEEIDLLREAEIAMYRAKRSGTDQIEIFRAEMRAEPDERSIAEAEIRKAIERNQLKYLFQPIVYLPTEEIAGFEVSMRWDHPKHGPLDPIRVLERTGNADLMRRVFGQAIAHAVKECEQWQKELPRTDRPLFASMTLPTEKMLEPELAQHVRQALGANGLPKGTLKLAIAESLVMDNPERATEVLEWFRGAGAELVLDNFGGGFSSLPYLGRLPFETFRIDRALMAAESGRDGSSTSVVKAMVALCHELDRKVEFDGVETDEEISFLRSIECEYATGLYYGEPISERDVVQLLKLVRKSERRMQPRGLFRIGQKTKKPKPDDASAVAPVAAASPSDRGAEGAPIPANIPPPVPPLQAPGVWAESQQPAGAPTPPPMPLPPLNGAEPIVLTPQAPRGPLPLNDPPSPPRQQPPQPQPHRVFPSPAADGTAWSSGMPEPPPSGITLPRMDPFPGPLQPAAMMPMPPHNPPILSSDPTALDAARPLAALQPSPFPPGVPPPHDPRAYNGPPPMPNGAPHHAPGPMQHGPNGAAPNGQPPPTPSGDGLMRPPRPIPRPRPTNLSPQILASLDRLAGKPRSAGGSGA